MGTYLNHEKLKKPKDDIQIWRYMDFTKFVSILYYKSLYFARVDTLKDPYEVSATSYIMESTDKPISHLEDIKMYEQKGRQALFVNCWHINAFESAALWKAYMKSDEGIAIQTTVKKLVKVLENSNQDIFFDLASINYDPRQLFPQTIKPKGEVNISFDMETLLFTKRPCFQYEHELRVIVKREEFKSTGFNWGNLDINSLIESIYVNPEAPDWIISLVRDLAKSYNIHCNICKSKIY